MRFEPPALGFVALWLAGIGWNVTSFDVKHERELEERPLILSLPRPEVVKFGSLGFAAALADLYWIGASHYFGEPRFKPVNYFQLHEYFDIVNELAPDFHEPYYYGGAAIPWNTGKEWVNVEAAVAVLRRGAARFPNDWRLIFLLASDLGTSQGDCLAGGRLLPGAAEAPHSPAHLLELSARYLAMGGALEQADALTDTMIETAPDENTKEVMKKHKEELAVERDIRSLEAAVESYRNSHGGTGPSSADLKDFEVLLPRPFDQLRDPHGDRYKYDAVTSTFSSLTLDRFRPFGVKKTP